MSGKRKCAIAVLFAVGILWTVFIFCRSMKSGEESSTESGRLAALLQFLLGNLPVSEHFVRKLAHFGEYLILALPLTGAVLLMGKRWLPVAVWGYAVAVALCDEFIIQAITPGRGPRFSDVLIDSAGALVGAAAMVALFYLSRYFRERRLTKAPGSSRGASN